MTAESADERFKQLYLAHADAIRSYCHRRLDFDDAQDAAADVFVVVWRRLDDCPAGDEARLWIYGIARNTVANRRRAAARTKTLFQRAAGVAQPDDPGPEAVIVRRSEYEQLDAALARLPDRYREVLIMLEWDGLDRESIATLEGVSRAAIDQRVSRAYKKLARLMNEATPRKKMFEVPHTIEERG